VSLLLGLSAVLSIGPEEADPTEGWGVGGLISIVAFSTQLPMTRKHQCSICTVPLRADFSLVQQMSHVHLGQVEAKAQGQVISP
jgi:hypothetical protein